MKGGVTKIRYKIVFLGDQNVGKTALINRFINNTFDQSYNATIGIDFLVKNISYGQKHYRLQLWDTAGQQRFKSLIPSYLKDSSCCFVLYDVTNIQSLENAFKWLELYNQHKNIKAIAFLIGNKIDLPDKYTLKQITQGLLQVKLKTNKIQHYLVSAKDGVGIEQTFQKITTVLDKHMEALALGLLPEEKIQRQILTAQTLIKEENKFHLEEKVEVQGHKNRNCCI